MNWSFLWNSLAAGGIICGLALILWFACWSSYELSIKITGQPNTGVGLVLYFLQLSLYAGIIGAVATGDW